MVDEVFHVYVDLKKDENGYPPYKVEEIDAVKLGYSRFQICGAPVFVFGLAPGDIVKVVCQIDDGLLWVEKVLEPSDNWLARVLPREGVDPQGVVDRFSALGCCANLTRYGLITVVVPPEVPAESVVATLEDGQERQELWYFDMGVNPPS